MHKELNASVFVPAFGIYESEFQNILRFIISCYRLMIRRKNKLKNNENIIRNCLYLDYLNNNLIRRKLKMFKFFFVCEGAEINPANYTTKGYTDIKIFTQDNSFVNTSASYIIECKRLDGKNDYNGLNAKYIQYGISRFIINKYPSFGGINGMLGFIVKKINIKNNTAKMNHLLKNRFKSANTISYLRKNKFISGFNFSYVSRHIKKSGQRLKLYHLMLDFSNNINSSLN